MKPLPIAISIVCFLIAALYATGVLQIGASHGGRHVSHAALFAALGILSLIWGRFSSAPAARRR